VSDPSDCGGPWPPTIPDPQHTPNGVQPIDASNATAWATARHTDRKAPESDPIAIACVHSIYEIPILDWHQFHPWGRNTTAYVSDDGLHVRRRGIDA